MWLLLGAIVVFSVGITLPMVKRQRIKANQTSAVSSLRGVGFALYEFESEYGRFPDATTASKIKQKTGTRLTLSDRTSNDIFVQLLASELLFTETVFNTHSGTSRKPDENWSSDDTALEHGETGFAFISGLSSKDNPSCPIVFGPVIPGTKTIDMKSFDGKAVILDVSGSIRSTTIDSSGRIMINGFGILDPQNPLWNGKAPDVKWPK